LKKVLEGNGEKYDGGCPVIGQDFWIIVVIQ
jgi:hypothetical protein